MSVFGKAAEGVDTRSVGEGDSVGPVKDLNLSMKFSPKKFLVKEEKEPSEKSKKGDSPRRVKKNEEVHSFILFWSNTRPFK